MGGAIENRKNASHFIVSRNKVNLLLSDAKEKDYKPKHILNLKFIIHTFYFMMKLDENDTEYTDLF